MDPEELERALSERLQENDALLAALRGVPPRPAAARPQVRPTQRTWAGRFVGGQWAIRWSGVVHHLIGVGHVAPSEVGGFHNLGTVDEPRFRAGFEVEFRLETPRFGGEVRPRNPNFWHRRVPRLTLTRAETGTIVHVRPEARDVTRFRVHLEDPGVWVAEIRAVYPGGAGDERVRVSMAFEVLTRRRFALEYQASEARREAARRRQRQRDREEQARAFAQHAERYGGAPRPGMGADRRALPDGRVSPDVIPPQQAVDQLDEVELPAYLERIEDFTRRATPLQLERANEIMLAPSQRSHFRYNRSFEIDRSTSPPTLRIVFDLAERSSRLYLGAVPPARRTLRYRFDEVILYEVDGARVLATGEDLALMLGVQEILSFVEVISALADLLMAGEGTVARVLGRQARRLALGELRRAAARRTARLVLRRFRRAVGRHVVPGVGLLGRRALLVRGLITDLVKGLLDTGYEILKSAILAALQESRRQLAPQSVEEWRVALGAESTPGRRIARAASEAAVERISDEIISTVLPRGEGAARSLEEFFRRRFYGVLRRALDSLLAPEHVSLLPRGADAADLTGPRDVAARAVEDEFDSMVRDALTGRTVARQLERAYRARRRVEGAESRRVERARRLRRRQGRSRWD